MSDKQVIMSKTEFDKMEEELDNLRKVVEDKTITKIKTPHLSWNGAYTYVDSYFIEYIFGTEESEIVKELKEEIDRVKENNDNLKDNYIDLESRYIRLKLEENNWKQLPWYKRLFV
jgi:hypothetical protein